MITSQFVFSEFMKINVRMIMQLLLSPAFAETDSILSSKPNNRKARNQRQYHTKKNHHYHHSHHNRIYKGYQTKKSSFDTKTPLFSCEFVPKQLHSHPFIPYLPLWFPDSNLFESDEVLRDRVATCTSKIHLVRSIISQKWVQKPLKGDLIGTLHPYKRLYQRVSNVYRDDIEDDILQKKMKRNSTADNVNHIVDNSQTNQTSYTGYTTYTNHTNHTENNNHNNHPHLTNDINSTPNSHKQLIKNSYLAAKRKYYSSVEYGEILLQLSTQYQQRIKEWEVEMQYEQQQQQQTSVTHSSPLTTYSHISYSSPILHNSLTSHSSPPPPSPCHLPPRTSLDVLENELEKIQGKMIRWVKRQRTRARASTTTDNKYEENKDLLVPNVFVGSDSISESNATLTIDALPSSSKPLQPPTFDEYVSCRVVLLNNNMTPRARYSFQSNDLNEKESPSSSHPFSMSKFTTTFVSFLSEHAEYVRFQAATRQQIQSKNQCQSKQTTKDVMDNDLDLDAEYTDNV